LNSSAAIEIRLQPQRGFGQRSAGGIVDDEPGNKAGSFQLDVQTYTRALSFSTGNFFKAPLTLDVIHYRIEAIVIECEANCFLKERKKLEMSE